MNNTQLFEKKVCSQLKMTPQLNCRDRFAAVSYDGYLYLLEFESEAEKFRFQQKLIQFSGKLFSNDHEDADLRE